MFGFINSHLPLVTGASEAPKVLPAWTDGTRLFHKSSNDSQSAVGVWTLSSDRSSMKSATCLRRTLSRRAVASSVLALRLQPVRVQQRLTGKAAAALCKRAHAYLREHQAANTLCGLSKSLLHKAFGSKGVWDKKFLYLKEQEWFRDWLC